MSGSMVTKITIEAKSDEPVLVPVAGKKEEIRRASNIFVPSTISAAG